MSCLHLCLFLNPRDCESGHRRISRSHSLDERYDALVSPVSFFPSILTRGGTRFTALRSLGTLFCLMEKKNSLDERKKMMNISDKEIGMCLKISGMDGEEIPICFC